MGLTILHSADWHLGFPFASFPPEQRKYLQEQLQAIPQKVADLCRRENCDLVLLSGDLLDSPEENRYTDLLARALESCGVPVFIAPGNHDYLTRESVWLCHRWPDNVHIFPGQMSGAVPEALDCRVWGAGYTSMDSPGLLENFRAEGPERWQLGVLHADPLRRTSPYCPVTAAQLRSSGLDYLALGHIHRQGNFRCGGLCAWPGAPMGRGFDESGSKGVYIVHLNEEAQLRFVSLDAPEFRTAELPDSELDGFLGSARKENFYRITLTGEMAQPLEEIMAAYAHLPNLEWIDLRYAPADPWARAGEESLEGIYFRLLREKLEKASGEEREIIELAAKLSGEILEHREVAL